ncbi:hypothetical protein EVAR_43053_1 [Eumeta japonica]|uniref:DNA endonuclease RBBP8 n=1 Tax=Eumeta variegata TaxID=151549 RepID=A0A4C1WYY5_EUMVA|nr:hypothetical protein EVAR_43053_1 [Eumeta japonica]
MFSEAENLQNNTKKELKLSLEVKDSNFPINDNINDVKTFHAISIGEKHEKDCMSPTTDSKRNDQSVSDNEGTSTGRCSPVFSLNNKVEKKKLSSNWRTPESKVVKLTIPSSAKRNKSGGKLKQARFNFVHSKTSQIIDASTCTMKMEHNPEIEAGVKVESIENDDTIMPSPTSGPIKLDFVSGTRNLKKFESPNKIFTSNSMTKYMQNDLKYSLEKIEDSDHTIKGHNMEIEDSSIDLLHPEKIKHTDNKEMCVEISMEHGLDHETDSSISLLKCLEKNEDGQKLNLNTATENSLLKQRNCVPVVKKENVEHIYKEPAPRKKAEKKSLPGWKCDQCRNFYGVLHKDDPVMLEKRMSECSKHRGRTNPIQPQTPPGLWDPRWHVEEDTEVFNKQNNVT